MRTINLFEEYLQSIKDDEHAKKLSEVIMWVQDTFPQLNLKIAWNQPIFTEHETYIIGFSASTKHFSIAPEKRILDIFMKKIEGAHYSCSKNLFRISWNDRIDCELLREIIDYSIKEKKDCKTFWMK